MLHKLTPELFRAQMAYLKKLNEASTVDELNRIIVDGQQSEIVHFKIDIPAI